MAEYWDAYDGEEKPLGFLIDRAEAMRTDALPPGAYHLVVEIWTVSGGRLLLTRRVPEKPFGGYWECTGGSVVAGEDALTGACRELAEETGLVAAKEALLPLCRQKRRNCFLYTYAFVGAVSEKDLHLQAEEVSGAKFVTPEELEAMIGRDEFCPPIVQRLYAYKERLYALCAETSL